MIKPGYLIILLCLAFSSNAQYSTMKFGAMGFFTGEAFGIATLGAEFFQKNNTSWQILFNISGGAGAIDADIINRQWLSIDRVFIRKPMAKHDYYFLSLFTEIGNRNNKVSQFKREGYRLVNIKQFEINHGIAVGANFKIKRRWGIDMIAGPKLIIASGKKRYFDPITAGYDFKKFKSVEAGYRFMINLSYSFKK